MESEFFEERAAILEYEAGYSRQQAERLAREMLAMREHQEPPTNDPARVCTMPDATGLSVCEPEFHQDLRQIPTCGRRRSGQAGGVLGGA